MNNESLQKLKEELISIFLKYSVVPQGYDFELWTKENNNHANETWRKEKKSFEKVVQESVDSMFVNL